MLSSNPFTLILTMANESIHWKISSFATFRHFSTPSGAAAKCARRARASPLPLLINANPCVIFMKVELTTLVLISGRKCHTLFVRLSHISAEEITDADARQGRGSGPAAR